MHKMQYHWVLTSDVFMVNLDNDSEHDYIEM